MRYDGMSPQTTIYKIILRQIFNFKGAKFLWKSAQEVTHLK